MNKTEYWEQTIDPEWQEARSKAYSDMLAYVLRGTVPKGMTEVDKHHGTVSLLDSLPSPPETGRVPSARNDGGTP